MYSCAVWVGPSYDNNEKHGSLALLAVACLSHMVQSQQCHSWCLKSTKGNMLFSLVPRLEEEEEKGLGLAPPLWPGTEATCLRYRGTANPYFSDTCRKIFFLANKS